MLLPVGDRTAVGAIFRSLEEEDRIDDVYVSTNEAFADTFKAHGEPTLAAYDVGS